MPRRTIALGRDRANRRHGANGHYPAGISGLELAEGVERVGGDLDLFVSILQMYCDDCRDFCTGFGRLPGSGDFKRARFKAHDLKRA